MTPDLLQSLEDKVEAARPGYWDLRPGHQPEDPPPPLRADTQAEAEAGPRQVAPHLTPHLITADM